MPKTFDVPVAHDDEPYTIQPFAVAFIRRQQVKRAIHADDCIKDGFCPLEHPANATLPDMNGCRWSDPEDATEICFTNTTGAQSSVVAMLPKRDVKNLLDEAIRYNL